jgi:succinate dehydrogenase / fumarate reductase cytochrome b subunit
LIWAFVHHLLAGLRHLALDVHWGVDLRHARQTGSAVLLATGLVTLLAAWRLFA